MRGVAGLRPVAEEEDVEPAGGLQFLDVGDDFRLEVGRVRAQGVEAPDAAEELGAEQPLEVAHEAESVLHRERGERVLREDA